MRISLRASICVASITFLLLFLAIIAGPALADKEEECDAVDEIAKIAVRDYDTVTVSADRDNRICRFSVNGATVGSPPREQVRQAYSSLIWNNGEPGIIYRDDLSQKNVPALASLLLAAGPDSDVTEMAQVLEEQYELILECKSKLFQGSPFTKNIVSSIVGDANVSCDVMSTDYSNIEITVGPVTIRTIPVTRPDTGETEPPVPQMVLAVQRGSGWVVLSVPGL